MASVSTYLNFAGTTAEAFEFYRGVFGTEYRSPVMRMGDVPPSSDMPPMDEATKALVMHVELPILADHSLMGTDVVEAWGHTFMVGNNVSISLHPDTREDADRLFGALSEGGSDVMALQDMFWGAYFGSFRDRYGVQWMINVMHGAAAA